MNPFPKFHYTAKIYNYKGQILKDTPNIDKFIRIRRVMCPTSCLKVIKCRTSEIFISEGPGIEQTFAAQQLCDCIFLLTQDKKSTNFLSKFADFPLSFCL